VKREKGEGEKVAREGAENKKRGEPVSIKYKRTVQRGRIDLTQEAMSTLTGDGENKGKGSNSNH